MFAFGSAIFGAIANIINKKILTHEHVQEFTATEGIVMTVLALILLPFVNLQQPWYVYLFIYFVSIMVAAGSIFYLKGLRHGEISTISPLMNLSPIFLLIISFVILSEVPTSKQYVGIFFLIFGAYALEVGITNRGFLEPVKRFLKSKITHFLIFAMVIFSITATFDKLIVTRYTNFITYLFLLTVFKSFNFIFLEVYKFGWRDVKKDFKKDWKMLWSSGIASMLSQGSYLIAASMPNAMISLIVPIKRTGNLFTTIFGGKLFHEKNLFVKILACIIMIWGAVFILL